MNLIILENSFFGSFNIKKIKIISSLIVFTVNLKVTPLENNSQ